MTSEETINRIQEAVALAVKVSPEQFLERTGFDQESFLILMNEVSDLDYKKESTLLMTGFNIGYICAELAEGDRIKLLDI